MGTRRLEFHGASLPIVFPEKDLHISGLENIQKEPLVNLSDTAASFPLPHRHLPCST